MKQPFRQGKRDALQYQPRRKPSFYLDRDQYNKGYEEGLAELRMKDEEEAHKRELMASEITGTYRHVKTGGVYEVVCEATLEADNTAVVVYRNIATCECWVRPKEEFIDGRFEEVA